MGGLGYVNRSSAPPPRTSSTRYEAGELIEQETLRDRRIIRLRYIGAGSFGVELDGVTQTFGSLDAASAAVAGLVRSVGHVLHRVRGWDCHG